MKLLELFLNEIIASLSILISITRIKHKIMGLRIRKSIKIAPGIRLNFGKKGISTSIGGRGIGVTFGPTGTTTHIGIPGTGVSYVKKVCVNKNTQNNISFNTNSGLLNYYLFTDRG